MVNHEEKIPVRPCFKAKLVFLGKRFSKREVSLEIILANAY
jgi:hypothetical protein